MRLLADDELRARMARANLELSLLVAGQFPRLRSATA